MAAQTLAERLIRPLQLYSRPDGDADEARAGEVIE
jgi:hypothetical protein